MHTGSSGARVFNVRPSAHLDRRQPQVPRHERFARTPTVGRQTVDADAPEPIRVRYVDDPDFVEMVATVLERADGFYVADDGPGIPEPDRDQVFDAGYSTHPQGTGFGLRIVEQVATAHGWTAG